MKKERAISVSLTNGAECICDPDIVLGDKYGLWDINNEVSPRGTLLDLNVAWELFISKQGFSNYTFEQQEDSEHERITYILVDKDKNPVGPEFTVETDNGEILVPITETITSLTAEKGKYYRIDVPVETLAITLPAMDTVESVKKVGVYFTAGTTPEVTITAQDGKKVLYQDGYEIEADKIYGINALFNGDTWVVDALTIKIPPFFAKLTLNDGSTVELQGSGELTNAMILPYKSSIVNAEIGELCTSIGRYTFYNCSSLRNITIPNSVTSIGESAFSSCSGLTSVTIGSGVTSIGDQVFQYCSSLTSVTIGSGVTSIGDYAFQDCTSLTSIVVDSANTVYDSRDSCNAVIKTSTNELVIGCKNTIIPNTVTSIGKNAFRACKNLTSITIHDSVTSIGESAFNNCTDLTSVTIGSGVTSISNEAFYYCKSLTSITIPDSVTSISNGAFHGCTNLISVTLGSGITSIGRYTFYNCSSLRNITIPNSVTSIGESAFSSCSGLTSVTIGSGVTSIGESAFSSCSSLRNITIPNNVTSIGKSAFSNSGLISITIPSSVTSIGDFAFNSCSGLTSIIIPDNITRINQYTFKNCSNLTSVTIGSGVTSISSDAFRNCTSLTSITSNKTNAPSIQSSTFQDVKTGGTLHVPSGSTGYDKWMGTGNYYLGKYNWRKVEQ